MTVQFAGSRSMDERRRRRLAVADGPAVDSEPGEEKSLPDCVPSEWCAAAPWIPRSLWKLWTLTGLFLAGIAALLALTWRTPEFRPELAPALDPLFRGSQPRLVVYLEIVLWTLCGQLSLLIGWHRSRSRLDFRGRYRFWPWAAAAMFGCGMCVATDLHLGLGALLTRWDFIAQQPRAVGWLLPAVCLVLPLVWLMDRDVRRSMATVILLRLTVSVCLAGALAGSYGSQWIEQSTCSLIESICGLLTPALLTTTLWIHGWYVAYITPDAPAASAWTIGSLFGSVIRWMLGWLTWPFRRRETVEAPTTTRRRKKPEEGTTPTRRRRKTKRKPRVRKVVEEEETEEEEYAEEEATPEEDEEEEASDEESYEEEEPEPEPPARVTVQASKSNQWRDADQRTQQSDQRGNANSQASKPQVQDEDEDEDEGGEQWRADGPPAEQLKGLSKRQRRALIKQYRDQQREQRGR